MHHIANLHINISNINFINLTNNNVSVLSIYYQLMNAQIETIPDFKTTMALLKDSKEVEYCFDFCRFCSCFTMSPLNLKSSKYRKR